MSKCRHVGKNILGLYDPGIVEAKNVKNIKKIYFSHILSFLTLGVIVKKKLECVEKQF